EATPCAGEESFISLSILFQRRGGVACGRERFRRRALATVRPMPNSEPTRSPHKSIRFAGFVLDAAEGRLTFGDEVLPLRRGAVAVLHYLALRPGRLVTKTEIFAAIWPAVTVSEIVLAVCISELRKVLDDSAKVPRFIETVHGRGYRFIGVIADERASGE